MSAWGDLVKQFNGYPMGSRLKISFRVESREYNGRWYTDVRPWKAVVDGSAASSPTAMDAPANFATSGNEQSQSTANSVEDDLPF